MKKKLLLFCIFSLIISVNLFSQTNTTPEPYSQDEFPQAMKDLRRFEIITLGSMPFITMDAAIVYNGYKYFTGKSDKFNPLATADYQPEEMKKIIATSLCISAGIGLTDFIIRLIKRTNSQKRNQNEDAFISISENPDAVKLHLPKNNSEENNQFESVETETLETVETTESVESLEPSGAM